MDKSIRMKLTLQEKYGEDKGWRRQYKRWVRRQEKQELIQEVENYLLDDETRNSLSRAYVCSSSNR